MDCLLENSSSAVGSKLQFAILSYGDSTDEGHIARWREPSQHCETSLFFCQTVGNVRAIYMDEKMPQTRFTHPLSPYLDLRLYLELEVGEAYL